MNSLNIENSKTDNTKCYAFILGRESKIALAELSAVLRRFGFDYCSGSDHGKHGNNYSEAQPENSLCDNCYSILSLQDNIAIIKISHKIKSETQEPLAELVMSQLGGTVKIFELMQNANIKDQNFGLEASIVNNLMQSESSGTLNFGISDYSETFSVKQLNEMGIRVKIMARKKRPVRYIASKERQLSSAASYHKILRTGGVEAGIFKMMNETSNPNSKAVCHSELAVPFPKPWRRMDSESHHRVSGNKNSPTPQDGECLIGKLVATFNPDEWSERDYGKPAGDKYSGMMPPKLARAMVNIALGQVLEPTNQRTEEQKNIDNSDIDHLLSQSGSELVEEKIASKGSGTEKLKIENLHNVVVLDPFCGSGNILMEALLLGCDVVGSDLSQKAVEDTNANLEWLITNNQETITSKIYNVQCSTINQKSKIKNQNRKSSVEIENSRIISDFDIRISDLESEVFLADATSANLISELKSRGVKEQQELTVVTEPYLGKPKKNKVTKSTINGEIEDLKSLYLGFFSNLKLAAKSYQLEAICFVFPLIETIDSGTVSLYDECIDDLQEMGYNSVCTLRYGRDYQVTKRLIAVLTTQNHEVSSAKQQSNSNF